MNRAHQQALFQETNQAVLGIRQLEINYYSNLYGVLGTQSILLAGFIYSTFTQNSIKPGNPYEDIFIYLYFAFSSMAIVCALHIMLCTMILQVYGPGLALHGPLGSMARAVEGLEIEQEQVVYSFFIMISAYALSTVWAFWTIMSTKEAITCTCLFFLVARQSYFYGERIYLRFYWNKNDTNWNTGDIDTEIEFEHEPQVFGLVDTRSNPMHSDSPSVTPHYKEKKLNFPFGISFKKKGGDSEKADAQSEPSSPTEAEAAAKGTGDAKVELGSHSSRHMIAMEGYFTTHRRSEQHIHLISESRRWDRQYFVLFCTGEYYIYKPRQAFRFDPKAPIYIRPLLLSDFFVKVDNIDEAQRKEYEEDGRTILSATSAGKRPAFRFQITLVPRENEESEVEAARSQNPQQQQSRNHWLLRCDTEEELEIWLEAIKDVCPSCFKDKLLRAECEKNFWLV